MRQPLSSTLFPYTTLFRSLLLAELAKYFVRSLSRITGRIMVETALRRGLVFSMVVIVLCASSSAEARRWRRYYSQQYIDQDRKSTRLNSSHLGISYAVFCL